MPARKSNTLFRRSFILLMLLSFLSSAAVIANNMTTYGSIIYNKEMLAYELSGNHSTPPVIYSENRFWERKSPFKYRITGEAAVYFTYITLSKFFDHESLYYFVYLFWCLAFLTAATLCCSILSHQVAGYVSSGHFQLKAAIISIGVFSSAPPILYAFRYPVHGSPNDFAGYALMALSLYSLLQNRIRLFTITVLIGIVTREQIFLCVFFLLFYDRGRSLKSRAAITATLFSVFIFYRLAWYESYSLIQGGWDYNVRFPVESASFLFLTFGVYLWIAIMTLPSLRDCREKNSVLENYINSFLPSLLLTLCVVLIAARFRENRILFVDFIHVVPFASIGIAMFTERVTSYLSKSHVLDAVLATLGLAVIGLLWFSNNDQHSIELRQTSSIIGQNIDYGLGVTWVNTFFIHFAATVAILVCWIMNYSRKHDVR